MTRYSVQTRYRIFAKGYRFFSFAKNLIKIIGRNISKNLSSKYNPGMLATHQKILDHAKQSATDAFKTASNRAIQKTAEATGDLIGNKIVNKIMGVSKNLQQNNSETLTNEYDKKIPKERYMSPKERQKIIDNLGINVIV